MEARELSSRVPGQGQRQQYRSQNSRFRLSDESFYIITSFNHSFLEHLPILPSSGPPGSKCLCREMNVVRHIPCSRGAGWFIPDPTTTTAPNLTPEHVLSCLAAACKKRPQSPSFQKLSFHIYKGDVRSPRPVICPHP